jgi:MFS transporter, DHA1 family, multidrug resistance protein
MRELLRDSAFGRILNLASGGKLFPWEEFTESDPLKQYLSIRDPEKPATLPVPTPRKSLSGGASTPTHLSNDNKASDSSLPNFEEGPKPYTLVDWKENDSANPRNWSTGKKFFVTFQICLLTTSVYIGSAIYTPGIVGIMRDFDVGEVAALLGLTLFVIGYALGPMIFVSERRGWTWTSTNRWF